MGKTRAEMRQALWQGAEEVIEEVLDWWERTETPNFSQIEEKVLAIRQQVSEKVAEVLIEGEAAADRGELAVCPRCGQGMENKGKKEKTVVGMVGEVRLRRRYYYCQNCQAGYFPPGPAA